MKDNIKNTYKQKIEEKLRSAKNISLSVEEKERMGAFLSSYVDFHPVLGEQERALRKSPSSSRRAWVIFTRLAPALVVVLFFVGGGVVLAERALPGDALYGFKIKSEEIRADFSPNTESRARFSAIRVERRLSEGQKLATGGTLTEETTHELIKNLEDNVALLQSNLTKLKEQDDKPLVAYEIDEKYHSSVRVYKELLTKISNDNANTEELIRQISLKLGPKEDLEAGTAIAPLQKTNEEETPKTPSVMSEKDSDNPSEENRDKKTSDNEEEISSDGTTENTLVAKEAPNAGSASEESKLTDGNVTAQSQSAEENTPVTIEGVKSGVAIDVLKLFVSNRIDKTRSDIKSSTRLDASMKESLLHKLESAKELYNEAVTSLGEKKEDDARIKFNKSTAITEDIQTILRISASKDSKKLLLLLLSRIEIQDESKNVEVLNSLIRELEGSVRESSDQKEDMSSQGLDHATEKEGAGAKIEETKETSIKPFLDADSF